MVSNVIVGGVSEYEESEYEGSDLSADDECEK